MQTLNNTKRHGLRCTMWLMFTVTISMLLLGAFFWGVMASAEGARSGAETQEVIHLEFLYYGADLSGAISAANQFAALLSQETGLNVQASVSSCEAGVVQGLGTGSIDVAPLRTLAYIVGHDFYGIEARLVNVRFGLPYYKSQINVNSASGYTSIADLQGTKFAAPDPASTSGYHVPYMMIEQSTGMAPEDFFSEIVFVGGHSEVIRQVYTGTVASGATFADARVNLVGELPDVLEVVEVLTTSKEIPNDPWVFNPALEPAVADTLAQGIIAVADSPSGKLALETFFGTFDGIDESQDSAYDFMRLVVAEFGGGIIPCQGTDTIGPSGGTITAADGRSVIEFPEEFFSETAILTHTVLFAGAMPSTGGLQHINQYFDISVVYSATGQPVTPTQTYSMRAIYADNDLGPAIEDTLSLYYWDGESNQWVNETSSSVDVVSNTVTASPMHFSAWAVLGETNRAYLPLVLREP